MDDVVKPRRLVVRRDVGRDGQIAEPPPHMAVQTRLKVADDVLAPVLRQQLVVVARADYPLQPVDKV